MNDYLAIFEAQNYTPKGKPVGKPFDLHDTEIFPAKNDEEAAKKADKKACTKESLATCQLKGTRKLRIRVKSVIRAGPSQKAISLSRLRRRRKRNVVSPSDLILKLGLLKQSQKDGPRGAFDGF